MQKYKCEIRIRILYILSVSPEDVFDSFHW